MAGLESHYAARDIEERILRALRDARLDPESILSPKDLGALDHFHTGGLRASLELMQMAPSRRAASAPAEKRRQCCRGQALHQFQRRCLRQQRLQQDR